MDQWVEKADRSRMGKAPCKSVTTLTALAMVLLVGGCTCARKSTARFDKVDVHVHASPAATGALVKLMNAHGIAVAVNLSGGWPGRGLEQTLAAAAQTHGRVVVFANVPLSSIDDQQAMLSGLERAQVMGAKGLKFFKSLGLTARDASGSLISVDDPRLDALFEKAGALGMPVAIHTGDPVAFWLPVDAVNERVDELQAHPGWSYFEKDVPTWEALFAAFERRVARHPKTTIIGVHFGNAPEAPARVAAMLEKYPNYFVDTAARVPELGRRALREVFIRFEDRILFGTDLGVGEAPDQTWFGSRGREPSTPRDEQRFFDATWKYFESGERGFESPTPIQGRWSIDGIDLPKHVLEKIYGANARRVLKLEKQPE